MNSDAKMKTLLYLLFILVHSPAIACGVVPQYYSRSYSEVILDSDSIFLARVISMKENVAVDSGSHNLKDLVENASNRNVTNTSYNFELIETLKGKQQSNYLKLGLPPSDSGVNDFNGHRDYQFWLDNGGRVKVSPDCSLRPSFIIGKTYLIIEGRMDSYKSYEVILDRNDAWLTEVRNILKVRDDQVANSK